MMKFEPMPMDKFPKDLQQYPGPLASELYSYRAISRGPAKFFNEEYEDVLRRKLNKKRIAFHLPQAVLFFFCKAAAEGVVGNLAYAALCKLVNRIRTPMKEFFGSGVQFETVISRTTYNRLKRARHPVPQPSKPITASIESKVETQYRLMVVLKPTTPRKRVSKTKKD
jgi:hypothetical protein